MKKIAMEKKILPSYRFGVIKMLYGLLIISACAGTTLLTQAQHINWNNAPQKGFVFEISNKEAQKLLTTSTSDTIFNGLLHTQIDTFDVKRGWTNRPAKGHFILAKIIGNKLYCEYTCVFPYQVFLLKEYDALALQVLDLNGNVREDAKVKFKFRRLRIDSESKTYRLENDWFTGNNRTATVELDGFRSIFNIQKHEVPSWDNNNYDSDNGPTFYSYMITDKNKYKPNEHVRFKSYALSQSKSPLRKELEIWLYGNGKRIKLGQIAPHRAGSYAGEFHLHDSLKLSLDRDYYLQLSEKKGRIVAGCNFKYEDYELFGNKLDVKLAKYNQFYPEKNELTIKATDVNGLILKDAKATVLIKPQTIRETFQPLVILPDTLFFTQLNLDPNNPTHIDIPSSLFQKTNTTYTVWVTVLNSENERMERAETATHFYSQYELTTHFSNDSICFNLLNNNEPMNGVPIKLRHNGELEGKDIRLPYQEKLNPATTAIYLENELVSKQITMSHLNPRLELIGGLQKDSFNVRLDNPQRLEVSWFIYQGENLLKKGFGKELDYTSLVEDRTKTYYVELLYSFGGEEHIERSDYEFNEAFLNVSLNIPDKIYPGQQVNATIHVSDQLGQPVKGVDLTAMAVTGKLNYYLPDLPYYGTSSAPRSQKAHYSKNDINKRSAVLDLNYRKWEKPARLDTMKYFQFTYPRSKPFKHTVTISDSTQFAPYVMQNGLAKQVFVIEANKRPVYYSWVDQPKEYSFYISPKGKKEISLRLFDRVLVLDSIAFEPGKKTILSLDLNHLPKSIKVYKLGAYLTGTETGRHHNYIAAFSNVAYHPYLESKNEFTPLYTGQNRSYLVAGPITPEKKTYIEPGRLKTTYQHTGGYSYAFEDNIVYKLDAPNLMPNSLSNITFDPMSNVNDSVLTKKHFLENKEPSAIKWHARAIDVVDPHSRIKILLPYEEKASGIATVIFENCQTKNTIALCHNDYGGDRTDFYITPKGCQNAIVIYQNGTYLKMDSVNLKQHSTIIIDLNHGELHPMDSLSKVWLAKHSWATSNCYNYWIANPSQSWSINNSQHNLYNYSQTLNGNVKGVIYDENNTPLVGACIVVKGSRAGTVANIDGRFSVEIENSKATLVISFIGYESKEIEVTRGSDISVTMVPSLMELSEVVVVGYGARMRSDLTGSVSHVSGVNIRSMPDKSESPEDKQKDKTIREAEQKLYQELLTLNSIRSNFSDVGFWEPRLFTDKHGESKFKITFPDDITRWDALVYAMNSDAQTGTLRKSIKSYKPLMAELHVPQFLTRGDSAFFLGKVLNYTRDSSIVGKVQWSGAQTDFNKSIQFSSFHADKLPVNAISTDSITTRYKFTRDDGYLDGEERTVPVVEQGIVRADGTLSILNNKEERYAKASGIEAVTIEILSNQIDIYAQEASYLLNYKYCCNEQLASKLIGLINHKLIMKYEGKPFKYDKDINKIIARLLKNQNQEFLWSWWDVSPHTSYWMSAHILCALKCAKDAGYQVDLNIENIARKAEYSFEILHNYSLYDIDLLRSLAIWGAKLDYRKRIHVMDSLIHAKEYINNNGFIKYYYRYSLLKEKLLLQEIRQMAGLPYQRDSLLKYKKNGIMGELYFSDNKPTSYWYNDNMAANIIAYRIVKNDSLLKNLLVPMQMYFLSSRKNGGWNTYQSSNVLMSILPDLLAEGVSKGNKAAITVSGKENSTVKQFPYHITLQPNEELRIHKESGLPVYYMQYIHERVTKAKTGVEGFTIKTNFSNDSMLLEAGKPVALRVEVEVKKDASFENIMIEVPIPGACSYADKRQAYYGIETHREYFKDRTVIFCDNMREGKYVFTVQLLPRFTGKYLMNPAQVSLMYVPVVNANTDMKVVEVKDQK